MTTRRGERVLKSMSWGKKVARSVSSTMMTMMTTTMMTFFGERVAKVCRRWRWQWRWRRWLCGGWWLIVIIRWSSRVSLIQSVICQLIIIQSVILQIVSNYVILFLMIILRIGDATEDNARWLNFFIYKSYIWICILSPYSLAIKHSTEVIVDAVVKWVFMHFV